MTEFSKEKLFTEARTYNSWEDKDIPDAVLKELYDLVKMAPTSANCQPMRVYFIKSEQVKQRLKPCLAEGNVDKTMNAPVVALIAKNMEFYEELPKLFPHTDAKSWFVGNPDNIEFTATQNTNMQAGYFIMAARGLGLDCGPMAGFDKDRVDEEFLKDTENKSVLLINLGYGTEEDLHPRSPRPEFDEFCEIL